MPKAGRYLVGQKLSDYQFEKLIRAFAYGEQASRVYEASQRRKGGRAANTIFRAYELIRSRLVEIGYFPEPADYWRDMQRGDARYQFPFSETAARIAAQEERLRGASRHSARLVLAEMIFRAENPKINPEALFLEIRMALRTTGPLNRPPSNVDIWLERLRINSYRRAIDEHRAMRRPDIFDPLIASNERLIKDAEREIRRKLRKRYRGRLSGSEHPGDK
jgi:hypothetical protein